MINILVVGGGGREHALAWKLAQSTLAGKIYVAPGNAGTELEDNIQNVDIAADDIDGLLNFAQNNDINLTVIGPEVPLVLCIVDLFESAGLRCFGPHKAPAQLEGSKAFTKDFLARHNIPTAWYEVFTEIEPAIDFINQKGAPIVVKADGLAAGKGVIVAQSTGEAIAAVKDMLAGNAFGEAGSRVVIEEFLVGEEASFIVMVDGQHILPMATSQDHKARDEGDTGPNTGGMGAYSPAPVVTADIEQRIMDEVIRPTVDGLSSEGMPYTGFLYAGIMLGDDGIPKVLEYNCRFGDPETQPIMLRLKSDLVPLIEAALDGKLNTINAEWDSRSSLGVVLAAGGYPDDYHKGDIIKGLPKQESEDEKVFHAGTSSSNGNIVTAGGRVLCATALGHSIADAQARAYKLANKISWNDLYKRSDIGHRAINRAKN